MPFVIVGALIIGLLLGLMGSGGSILTVPVLVYLLGHDGKVAIAESLAIVGAIALATMLPYARSRLVNWRNVFYFGVPGMAGTYLGAWLSGFVPGAVQLVLFAVVMLMAALVMLRRSSASTPSCAASEQTQGHSKAFWIIGLEGLTVGIVTGLVGVGGGFLIVPALVVLGKLPMRVAIGTSLAVIALKSFSGFYKYLDVLASAGATVDWPTVALFVLLGIIGSYAGHRIATQLNQRLLQRAFALFLLGMGLFVLMREAPRAIAKVPPQAAAPTRETSDAISSDQPIPIESYFESLATQSAR